MRLTHAPHEQPIVVLTDSKGLMTVASNRAGEGKDPLLRHSPDGDILAHIVKVLHQRVNLGPFTMFIKIRAHRGEFLNEKARTCALSRGCAFFPKLANVTVTFFLATRCIQAVDVKHVLTLQPDHVTIVHENVNVFVKFLVL